MSKEVSMASLNVPSPEEVQKEIKSVFPIIHTALEQGTLQAREFFEREDTTKQIDRYLAPNLVRWWAKKYLQKAGYQISEDQTDYSFQPLANNGLSMKVGRYRLRILKSDDGDAPVPGDSVSRQNFYQQISIVLTTEDGIEIQDEVTNLLVLWDTDFMYNLNGLSLAYPKCGGNTKASVQLHWHVPIMHPAFSFTVDASAEPVQETDNLPLTLKKIDQKTEEAG